jgi:hypothetical protein
MLRDPQTYSSYPWNKDEFSQQQKEYIIVTAYNE